MKIIEIMSPASIESSPVSTIQIMLSKKEALEMIQELAKQVLDDPLPYGDRYWMLDKTIRGQKDKFLTVSIQKFRG